MGWACFFMSNGGGIMLKLGLEVDLWWVWSFENIVTYNSPFLTELCNFASPTALQSAPGSPSKASEIDFMIITSDVARNYLNSLR